MSMVKAVKKSSFRTDVYQSEAQILSRIREVLVDQIRVRDPKLYHSVEDFLGEFKPFDVYPHEWWTKMLRTFDTSGDFASQFLIKIAFQTVCSFSIPSLEVLSAVKDFCGDKPFYEYMAGTGYWAFLLKKMGLEVFPSSYGVEALYPLDGEKVFLRVKKLDIRLAWPEPNSVAMFSWIPYNSDLANMFLFKMEPGQKLIIVGESWGGCTASDSFFEILQNEFEFINDVRPPQFLGMHDCVFFYVKKWI